MWRNFRFLYMANVDISEMLHICHVETWGEISNFYRTQMKRNLKFSTSVKFKSPAYLSSPEFDLSFPYSLPNKKQIKCTICGVLSQFMPFCCDLRCFVAKTVLSRFTRFCRENSFVAIYALLCGEKLNPKLYMWRKNDKYQVRTYPCQSVRK